MSTIASNFGHCSFAAFTSANNSRSPTTATLASMRFATYSIWDDFNCLYKVDGVAPQ